jgi:hypothetical protein
VPDPEAPTDLLQVDSRSSDAVRTTREYPSGTRLRVTVTGTYLMRASTDHWIAADAECSATAQDWDWRSMRYEGLWDGKNVPLGDLAVNGSIITWAPADGTGSCDRDHVYSYDLTTSRNGPVWFEVVDSDYSDNKGALEVEVSLR